MPPDAAPSRADHAPGSLPWSNAMCLRKGATPYYGPIAPVPITAMRRLNPAMGSWMAGADG